MELRPEIRRASRRIVAGFAAGLTLFGFMSLQESPRQQRSEKALTAYAKPLGSMAVNQMFINGNILKFQGANYTHISAPPQPLTPAEYAASKVTPLEASQWSKVNNCEEHGNWHVVGPTPGGLGIKPPNWVHYGGQFFFGNESAATPDEQILVAINIQPNPPDQDGYCTNW